MAIPIPGRIAEALRRSTVQIVRSNDSGGSAERGSGSGVVLLGGQVVTNAHVVGGSDSVSVESWEGVSVTGAVVRRDRRRDLALLAVPSLQAPALTLADSDGVRPGMPVVAVGNPLGFVGAASSGVVYVAGGGRWIQADVRLAPGNSGGPLANLQGEVIGINTMMMAGGLALAIPSRMVQTFLAAEAHPRKLGVTVRPVRLARSAALLILETTPEGGAELASLLAGDLIVSVDGRPTQTPEDLEDAIDRSEGTLHVQFYRGYAKGQAGKVREVAVRLQAAKVPQAA